MRALVFAISVAQAGALAASLALVACDDARGPELGTTATPLVATAPPVEASVEACDRVFEQGGSKHYYAERLYPGASLEELLDVAVFLPLPGTEALAPPGYSSRRGVPQWVAAGRVAFSCNPWERVTFVRGSR